MAATIMTSDEITALEEMNFGRAVRDELAKLGIRSTAIGSTSTGARLLVVAVPGVTFNQMIFDVAEYIGDSRGVQGACWRIMRRVTDAAFGA